MFKFSDLDILDAVRLLKLLFSHGLVELLFMCLFLFYFSASSVFIVVVVATIVGLVVLIIGLMCLKRQVFILLNQLAHSQSRLPLYSWNCVTLQVIDSSGGQHVKL